MTVAQLPFSPGLFNTSGILTVLNLAIGITFIFLLFSFVVSALNEFLLTYLDKRADSLKQGLGQLLQDPEKVRQVLDHGLVDALSRTTNGTPAYIGIEPFTAAVLDVVKPADPNTVRKISDFQTSIAALPNSKDVLFFVFPNSSFGEELTPATIETLVNERAFALYNKFRGAT